MQKTIEFYYDFGSPNAHLAYRVLPGLARDAGAVLVLRPILLGGVFKATGNQSPMQAFAGVKGKLAHQQQEIARFCRRHRVPMQWNPNFPINTLTLMRGATYAAGKPIEAAYAEACFAALWERRENLGDGEVLARILTEAGLPTDEILTGAAAPETKAALIAATEAAVARGVYGAPMMFVGDEMFFGKSALDDLAWFAAQDQSVESA